MEIKVGDKVYVNSISHIAFLAGAKGIVKKIIAENGIGVSIFGKTNPMTISGYFWFNENELRREENDDIEPVSTKK